MTGRFRFGKMSTGIRRLASTLPRATATTPTMTVQGRRMAKTIGFIDSSLARSGASVSDRRSATPCSEGPVGPGVEVDDARLGLARDPGPEERLVGRLVAGVAHGEALPVDPLEPGLILAVHGPLQRGQLAVL